MASKVCSTLAASAFALAAASAPAFAGQVTLFQDQGFRGRVASDNIAVPDLAVSTFGTAASSIIVTDGIWEACSNTYFRGRCAELVPGNYSALSASLSGPVFSVRPIGAATDSGRIVVRPDVTPPAVVLAPAAVVVPSAPAMVVVDPNSATLVVPRQMQAIVPTEVIIPAQVQGRQPIVASGRAVLYQSPNFGGPSAVVQDGRAPDLNWTDLRYRASSIRIEQGRWLACTDIGYQGQCAVLSPGDYPVLTGTLSPGIASMWPIA